MHMPETDGFEIECQLAHSNLRVPVVIITGRDTPGDHERLIKGGATAFLLKPVDGHALLAAIAAATHSDSAEASQNPYKSPTAPNEFAVNGATTLPDGLFETHRQIQPSQVPSFA